MLNNSIMAVLAVTIVVLADKSITAYLANFYSPLEQSTLAYKIAYGDLFNSLFLFITGMALLLNVIVDAYPKH